MTDKEKKRVGRPIVGAEPKNVSLRLNLTKSEKKALEAEAKRTGKTMTQVISEFIKTLMK